MKFSKILTVVLLVSVLAQHQKTTKTKNSQ